MRIPAARLRPIVLATLCVTLTVAGCASTVTGTPVAAQQGPSAGSTEPEPEPETPSTPQALPTPGPVPTDGCRVIVSGRGSINLSGAGGRAVTRNGTSSFSCGSGRSLITIGAIAGDGVSFTVDSNQVSVTEGTTATVGPYQITTVAVDGDRAEFQVVPIR